jgi:predicted nucleic acid-binding Zn ribbon protein
MTTPVEPTRDCPSCGQTLTEGEKSCTRCGKEIPEVTKKAGKAKKTPAKAAKVECPHCGELVSKRSKKCPACMTNLPAGFHKVSDKSLDKETAEPKRDTVEQVAQVAVDEANSPCPSSPMVLDKSEPEHQEPIVTSEVGTAADQVFPDESAPAEEPLETVPSRAETTELVVPLEPASAKEPDVKTDEPSSPAELATPAESMSPGESSVASAGTAVTVQPIVASDSLPVEVSPSTAEVVTTLVDPVPNDTLPVESSKTIEDDMSPANSAPQVNFIVAQASSETVAPAEEAKSSGICEAIVPKCLQGSLADFVSAIEKEHIADQVQPTAEPLRAQPPAETGPPIDNSQPKPVRLVRKRKLKASKSPAAPVAAPADIVNGINGVRDASELGKMIADNAGNQTITK